MSDSDIDLMVGLIEDEMIRFFLSNISKMGEWEGAQKRLVRCSRLNYIEAVALIATQVGSHYQFIEVNPCLIFDCRKANGMRLNIPAGTATRFSHGIIVDGSPLAYKTTREAYANIYGKVIRDGMGQASGCSVSDCLDTAITNALIIDYTGIFKGGCISVITKAGNPDAMNGVFSNMVIGVSTEVIAGEGKIVTAGAIDCHGRMVPQFTKKGMKSGRNIDEGREMVEGTFPDGTKLITVHDPISSENGNFDLALHGSFLPSSNSVGSHNHFIEVNPCLIFDRIKAYGMRSNIPAGTATRFETDLLWLIKLLVRLMLISMALLLETKFVLVIPICLLKSKSFAVYGDECVFGGRKVIRDGMGQASGYSASDCLDTVITNALIIDYTGIFKADIVVEDVGEDEDSKYGSWVSAIEYVNANGGTDQYKLDEEALNLALEEAREASIEHEWLEKFEALGSLGALKVSTHPVIAIFLYPLGAEVETACGLKVKVKATCLVGALDLLDISLNIIISASKYTVNLLSVHKLARDSKLFIGFDEYNCYIQDLHLKKIMGTGSQHGDTLPNDDAETESEDYDDESSISGSISNSISESLDNDATTDDIAHTSVFGSISNSISESLDNDATTDDIAYSSTNDNIVEIRSNSEGAICGHKRSCIRPGIKLRDWIFTTSNFDGLKM
nr:hypothetical protein [Tanacetum cinerariifolium]